MQQPMHARTIGEMEQKCDCEVSLDHFLTESYRNTGQKMGRSICGGAWRSSVLTKISGFLKKKTG